MVHSQSSADLEKGDWDSQVSTTTPSHVGEPSLELKKVASKTFGRCISNAECAIGTFSPSVPEGDSNDPNVIGWDSPDDPENPVNFPAWRKWTLIGLVSAVTFMTGISSSMFAPGVPALMEEFHSTNSALGSFVVTIFVLGLAMGPLFFGPLSELYGRTGVQYVGCIGFFIFTIACALSTSLSMLIGMRLLQGTFAACPLTNGGGIIADMVRQEERGFAMSMFTIGSLFAPILGPVAGGFLASAEGWRWVFWLITILAGVLTCLCLTFWKESYAPVLLARKAARLRLETGNSALRSKYDVGLTAKEHFKRGIFRPMKMLVFSPILGALCLHMGLGYTYFYLLFTTFTPIFQGTYGFSSKTVGLTYLGMGVGMIAGQLMYAKLADIVLVRLAARSDGELKPEYRLPLGAVGGLFIPIGFFWFGWSAEAKVHWIVPIIGTGIAGFGNCLVFIAIQSYVIDAFTLYAASGLAAITVTRSIMAGVIPLAAPTLFRTLGLGWGNSLLAFLALAMIPIPIVLFLYGERMRGWNLKRINRL